VFHYFKNEMGCETVTIGEFAQALEKVLSGFKLQSPAAVPVTSTWRIQEADLSLLARESGRGCDLFFFPRLRDELRQQLKQQPRLLRFKGLRCCVKRLAGARRWSSRCQTLQDRIVQYLRECLTAEANKRDFALLVQ
jgi:hypothetical protein